VKLKRSIVLSIALLAAFCLIPHPRVPAQAVQQTGTASVQWGGNSWSGIPVPGGLWTTGADGPVLLYDGMRQDNSHSFTPTWVDLWNTSGAGTGLSDGQAVFWAMDYPVVNGHWHVFYTGKVTITWLWGTWMAVAIRYTATVTFIPD
jgi:hypothetical protein